MALRAFEMICVMVDLQLMDCCGHFICHLAGGRSGPSDLPGAFKASHPVPNLQMPLIADRNSGRHLQTSSKARQ
jgi:hypothetical protein